VFNTEKYLSRCLESVCAQTLKDIEIIVINDGSNDACGDIIAGFASRDNRIIPVSTANRGQSCARNEGLDIAAGEFIGFVDSDDTIQQDMYEILYNHATANQAEISICNYAVVTESDYSPRDKVCDELIDVENIGTSYIFDYIRTHHHGNSLCTRLYKACVIKENGIYLLKSGGNGEPEIGEDLFFNLKVALHLHKVAATHAVLYNYYQHTNSSMYSAKPRLISRITDGLQDFENYAVKHSTDKFPLIQRLVFSVLCEESFHYIESNASKQLKEDFRTVYNNEFLNRYIISSPAFEMTNIERAFKLAFKLKNISLYIFLERLRQRGLK